MRFFRWSNPVPVRYRRPLRRLIRLSAIVALVLLLVQALVLPRVVGSVTKSALSELGHPNATFRVSGATFFHTQLTNLDLGEGGGARAAAIGVDYSPWSLIRGRVKTVRIAGAELAITIRGNKVDLGVLGLGKTRTDPPGKTSKTPRPAPALSLPLDRLELRGCTLALDWDGRQIWVPVEGGAASPGAGAVHLALDLRLQGALARVNASFASADQFDVSASANSLQVAPLLSAMPASYAQRYPLVGSGAIDAAVRYTQAGADRRTTGNVSLDGVRLFMLAGGHRVIVGELSGKGSVQLDSAFGLADAAFQGGMRRLGFDTFAARDVTLKVSREDKVLRADVTAAGDDWKLQTLTSRIAGLFEQTPGAALRAAADVHLQGRPPADIREQLKDNGWNVDRAGLLTLRGNVEAALGEKWSVRMRSMSVDLARGDVVLAPAGIVFGGASAQLKLDADFSAAGATLRVGESSRIALVSFRQAGAGYSLVKAADGDQQAALVVQQEGVRASFTARGGWNVAGPALALEISPSRLELDGGTTLENTSALLRLRMDASDRGFFLGTGAGSHIAFDSLLQRVGDDVLRTAPWRMAIASEQGTPFLSVATTARGTVTRLNITAGGDAPLGGRSKDLEIAAKRLGVTLDAVFDDGPTALRARVDIGDASAAYKPGDLSIASINARIPFAWNTDVQERGNLHVRGAKLADTELAPITGALAMSGTMLKLSADSTVLDAGKLHVTGQLDLAGGKVRGVLDAQIPPFQLADATALARTAPVLKGYDVTGTMAARARLELTSVGIQPRFELSIKDGRLHNPQSGWLVEGIHVGGAGADPLVIDSLAPLSTPGGQTIKVARVTMGKVELTGGVFTFQIENPDRIFVEGTEWGWAGGRLYSNAFRLDRTRGALDAVISADRLRLEQVLPVFTDRVTGQGAVYGRLPISVRWPSRTENKTKTVDWNRPLVSFGDGFVYATPGGGRLQIRDPEQLVGKQLDQLLAADPRLAKAGVLDQVRARILKAMSDLDYDVLKLDLARQGIGPDSQTSGQAFLSGKEHGPVADPVPLGGITLLVDFDRLIRSVMGLQQRLGQ